MAFLRKSSHLVIYKMHLHFSKIDKLYYSRICFFLLWITVLAVILNSLMFRNSTCSRQAYSPPSLAPTSLRFSRPSMSVGSLGLGLRIRTLFSTTPSFNHEIRFTGVEAWSPLSVKLQISVTSSSCRKILMSETTTSGISDPNNPTT